MPMNRNEFWTLTIHFFARAVAAGVKPVGIYQDQWEIAGKDHEKYYRIYEFHFSNPPSKQDFLDMVRMMHWAQRAFKDDLLPVLDQPQNNWPMVKSCYKAATSDLTSPDGVVVGRLVVHQNEVWENKAYPSLSIRLDLVNELTRYIRLDKRNEAERLIDQKQNWIIAHAIQNGDDEGYDLKEPIRQVLIEGGFLKPKKQKPKI